MHDRTKYRGGGGALPSGGGGGERQERRRNNLQAFMHTMNSEIFFMRVMNKLMIDRYLDTKITDQIIGFNFLEDCLQFRNRVYRKCKFFLMKNQKKGVLL